ncbi:MAG: hypothetical protein ACHQHN_06760 [Sphingobacteriales bacterium]
MKKYLAIVMMIGLASVVFFIFQKNHMQYSAVVSIKNTRWQRVRIQVREGENLDSLNSKLIFDQYLSKGQSRSFTIDNRNNIIYRRDRDPNNADNLHFTKWIVAKCDNSSTFILNNP